MQTKNLVKRAERISRVMHFRQKDKGGRPYITHPLRVMLHLAKDVSVTGYEQQELAAALLHDVVEDTPMTLRGLKLLGMDQMTIEAVDALTHREGEVNKAYWARVKANPVARAVKLADIYDNTDPKRLALLDEATRIRLLAKYDRAHVALLGF